MTAALRLPVQNKGHEHVDLKKSFKTESSVRRFMVIDTNGAQRRLQIYNGDFRTAHFDVKLKPLNWQDSKGQIGSKRSVRLAADETRNPVKDGTKQRQPILKTPTLKLQDPKASLATGAFSKGLIKRLATASLIVSSVFGAGALVGTILQEPVVASGQSIVVTNETNLWQVAKKINPGNGSIDGMVAKIMELNSLDNSILRPGQEIIIPR